MLCLSLQLRRALTIALAALLLCAITSHAQLPAPPATTEDALRQMLDQSGAVFTGQVTAVRHVAALTEIDFAIDDAILGVAPNSIYTLREWTGVSPTTATQFAIGRRYLMFLHAPGPGGLSSPVGGPDGAIPILPGNQAASPTTPDVPGLAAQSALTPTTASTSSNTTPNLPPSRARTSFRLSSLTDSSAASSSTSTSLPATSLASSTLASSTIDLRWIATRVLAPVSYAQGSTTPADPILAHAATLLPSPLEGPTPAASQPPTTSANYSSLLTLLRSWHESGREEDHASR
jgi:hypothetical protein